MTTIEARKILQKIKKCNETACTKKYCQNCEYYVTKKKQREACDIAVTILLAQPKLKAEFFKSGIEFAKNEFVRILEKEKLHVGELHKSKEVNDLIYTQVLGLQKAIELADEVKIDEGIAE